MNITIKATNHSLTPEMRSLVEEKFSGLRKFTGDKDDTARLACEVEESVGVLRAGSKYRAEGNLLIDGKQYRAEATGETLEEAIDRVRDELSAEVRKSRGRARRLVKRGGAALKNMLRFGR